MKQSIQLNIYDQFRVKHLDVKTSSYITISTRNAQKFVKKTNIICTLFCNTKKVNILSIQYKKSYVLVGGLYVMKLSSEIHTYKLQKFFEIFFWGLFFVKNMASFEALSQVVFINHKPLISGDCTPTNFFGDIGLFIMIFHRQERLKRNQANHSHLSSFQTLNKSALQ